MNKSFASSIFQFALIIISFKIILDLICLNLVSGSFGPIYIYAFNFNKVLESYILVILSSFVFAIFLRCQKPSNLVYFLIYLFLVIPLLFVYGYKDEGVSRTFVYMALFSFFISIVLSKLMPVARFPALKKEVSLIGVSLLFFSSLYVYLSLFATGGLSRLNFNLYKVYEVRSQFEISSMPFMGYLIPWQAYVTNMLILLWGLTKRRKAMIVLAGVLQLLLFGMTNFKSFLFAPILVSTLFYIPSRKNYYSFLAFIATLSLCLFSFIYFITDQIMIPSILFRRLFLAPAEIHFWYYDFFSQAENPFIFLSNSFLSTLFDYPYHLPLTRVISWEYLNIDAGLNVGYLGDSYAHFGFAGMIIFSTVLGIFLYLVDMVCWRVPTNISMAMIAIPSMALINSALFTTFLTHGLLFCFFSLLLINTFLKDEYAHFPSEK